MALFFWDAEVSFFFLFLVIKNIFFLLFCFWQNEMITVYSEHSAGGQQGPLYIFIFKLFGKIQGN